MIPYTRAREVAHQYYRVLREKLPLVVGNQNAGPLQEFILESLQSMQHSSFSSKANVGVDMDRSKSWTKPWRQNQHVAKVYDEASPLFRTTTSP